MERLGSRVLLEIRVLRDRLAGQGLQALPVYKAQLVLREHQGPRVQLDNKELWVQQETLDWRVKLDNQVPQDRLDPQVQPA